MGRGWKTSPEASFQRKFCIVFRVPRSVCDPRPRLAPSHWSVRESYHLGPESGCSFLFLRATPHFFYVAPKAVVKKDVSGRVSSTIWMLLLLLLLYFALHSHIHKIGATMKDLPRALPHLARAFFLLIKWNEESYFLEEVSYRCDAIWRGVVVAWIALLVAWNRN